MKLEDIMKMVKKVEGGIDVLSGVVGEIKKAVELFESGTADTSDPAEGDKPAPTPVQGDARIIVRQVEDPDPTKIKDAEFHPVEPGETSAAAAASDHITFPCPVCGASNTAYLDMKDPDDTLVLARRRVACRKCGIFLGNDKLVEKAKAAVKSGAAWKKPEDARPDEGH